ncbi:MAG TPA: flagellar basal body P-ring formation chaperone FlgA [Nitrobacter sp.]|jgi:flagella basal body P-ring formation protein FlgA|nr:flagellar basal body P-ring formation chaperone FlgA [Nitrobacter sp.]
MPLRSVLLTAAMVAIATPALAQQSPVKVASAQAGIASVAADAIPIPVLKPEVKVSGAVVRIGDMIDNAGSAARIAIYRAPDLGTTGVLPTAQVLNVLRAHQVIGVDTRNIRQVSVTRLARTVGSDDIELQVAVALEHRNGLGDAKDLSLTFDTDVHTIQLDAANNGAIIPVATHYDPRNNRFDVTLEVGNDSGREPVRLRFTGTAVATIEAPVLIRDIDRGAIIKSSDVEMQRRPRAEVGNGVAARDAVIGMQARHQMRAGQALHAIDLAKQDLVQRDQPVTLIYKAAGIYLTVRGKAVDNGTDGDVVNAVNLQSKRTVTGVVVGRGQIEISPVMPRQVASAVPAAPADTADTHDVHVSPKAE